MPSVKGERGSMTAVALVLMGIVVLVSMVVAEAAWASFILKSAQATADFAAEAGSQFREEYARVAISRYHLREVMRRVCDPDTLDADGKPLCWFEPHVVTDWSYPTTQGLVADLKASWRDMFECADDPWTGWACKGRPHVMSPESANHWIEFTSAEPKAVGAFWANWTQRPSARVTEIAATPLADRQMVTVLVRVELHPLFLSILGPRSVWIKGQATVLPHSLQF